MKNDNFKLSTAEFKGSVLAQLTEIRNDLNTIREFIEAHNERITVIEVWKANLMGKISLAVGILSLAFTCLWGFVKEKFIKQ